MNKIVKEDDFKDLPIIGKQPENEKEEKYLREVRDFQFNNPQEPSLCHQFVYGNAKKNRKFTFFHDQIYRVPRFIARHVEECCTPLYNWRPDGKGSLAKTFTGNQRRFQMREVYRGN